MTEVVITREIRAARKAAGMTQKQAADVVGVSWRAWQDWELGVRGINPGLWELFLIKTKKIRQSNTIRSKE